MPITLYRIRWGSIKRLTNDVTMTTEWIFNFEVPEEDTQTLSFQSKIGPIEWIKPYTDEIIMESANWHVIVVPLGFVTDHVETLYEIDIQYKELAEDNNVKSFRRASVPNTDESYTKEVALFLRKHLWFNIWSL